jgi:hypothetical protein
VGKYVARVLMVMAAMSVLALAPATALAQRGGEREYPPGPEAALSVILGRSTDKTITVSVLSSSAGEAHLSWKMMGGASAMESKSAPVKVVAGQPVEIELGGLVGDRAYAYRLWMRAGASEAFKVVREGTFHTARTAGSAFVFALQGDSHPERQGKMYDPELYAITMKNVEKSSPDFYFLMGDDFSIERLIERKTLSQPAVDAIYAHQRGFLGMIGMSSSIFLVNGNHEQAAKYLLDGTASNAAVFAGKARTTFFPLPGPSGFYTGNAEPVEHIGLLRDYYAWTWGDALFVVIDPYWHSEVAVDNEAGVKAPNADQGREPGKGSGKQRGKQDDAAQPGEKRQGKGQRDLWQITLGDKQYQWLERTLTQSNAKYKFVFSHHVLGTGRGGVEQATKFEWGGNDQRGVNRFGQMRPQWEQPIHALMRDAGVTIFFQGHDHLYARQELEGMVYQSVPNPADPTYTAFNREAYKSGDVLPNSGHLRVTVGPEACKVEYVRSFRPGDENEQSKNLSVAHSYSVTPRKSVIGKASAKPGAAAEEKK